VKLSVLLITAVLIGSINHSIAAAPKTIAEADAGREVPLEVGQELILKLESNQSTGYSWALVSGKSLILTSLGKPSYEVGVARPGAGGVETWTFRATKIGIETLKFEYRRPWEKKVPPAKTVLFHVTVP
jgi:inhibitor of cysteine peptidase